MIRITEDNFAEITDSLKNGLTVRFMQHSDDTIFIGVVINPKKIWVKYLCPYDKEHKIADENSISHIEC